MNELMTGRTTRFFSNFAVNPGLISPTPNKRPDRPYPCIFRFTDVGFAHRGFTHVNSGALGLGLDPRKPTLLRLIRGYHNKEPEECRFLRVQVESWHGPEVEAGQHQSRVERDCRILPVYPWGSKQPKSLLLWYGLWAHKPLIYESLVP